MIFHPSRGEILPERDMTAPLQEPPEPVAYPPGIEDADGILIVEEGEHNASCDLSHRCSAPVPDILSLMGQLQDLRRRLAAIGRLLETLPDTWPAILAVINQVRRLAEEH